MRFFVLGAALLCLWGVQPLPGQEPPAAARSAVRELQHLPITTGSPEVQRLFDRGMVLVYAFNHEEAIRSFREAARRDPQCAMAHWGIALAYGPNINRPMPDEAVPGAYAALQRARELADRVSERERAYIEALAARYAPRTVPDRGPLDQAYAEAMRRLARRYPDDPDAATLFAEALMDTMPWDYWTKDGKPRPATAEAIAALETVMARHPKHLGANHYYIHVVEAGPNPERGLPAADRLYAIGDRLPDRVPGTGHLVHMPAHIYLRLGFHYLASRANERAIAADEAYLTPENAGNFYAGLYYPHKHGFLYYARMLDGRSREAIAAARKAAGIAAEEGPMAARSRTLPLFALVRFGRWQEILNEPRPRASLPFETAVWHYARGMAYAGERRLEQALGEAAALDRTAESRELQALELPTLYGSSQVKIAREVLGGEIAGLRGQNAQKVRRLEKAVALQDALPYMEPPYWHYPVRHSLGAALLRAGRPGEAAAVYREDLRRNPRNGWALFGLAQSLRAQGKNEVAAEVEGQFRTAWIRADVTLRNSDRALPPLPDRSDRSDRSD